VKRIGFLFEKAFTRENLYDAYLDARKKKRKKKVVFEFEKNLGTELDNLFNEIQSGAYRPKPYFVFYVWEPKKRMIYAPAFRDVVVQHAIYRIIYDLFNDSFVNTSYACRKRYGTHKASFYTQYALKQYENNLFTLKLDVRKFFYSIDRNILRTQLEHKIKDKRFVDFMMLFIDYGEAKGIPIGNLLSQIFALIYLSPIDRFVKHDLRIKHYNRYVDDFILSGLTKSECDDCLERIKQFLDTKLHLTLSKYSIQRVKKGVNFVGYRTWKFKRLIRKRSLYHYRKAVTNKKVDSIVSIIGHAYKTSSLSYMFKLLEVLYGNVSLPKSQNTLYHYYCRI
jgi:retron-type reverse transcriptase